MDDEGAKDRSWAPHDHFPTTVISAAKAAKAAYAQGVDRPLGSYAAITATYAGLGVAAGIAGRSRGRSVGMSFSDTVLATIATAYFARTTAKDPVTSFLRAPFTRFEGRAGEAELAEDVRGTGTPHAVGELLICPFCLGPWFAGAFVVGFAFAPKAARAAALVGTVSAGADVLQFGFGTLQRRWKRSSDDHGDG